MDHDAKPFFKNIKVCIEDKNMQFQLPHQKLYRPDPKDSSDYFH